MMSVSTDSQIWTIVSIWTRHKGIICKRSTVVYVYIQSDNYAQGILRLQHGYSVSRINEMDAVFVESKTLNKSLAELRLQQKRYAQVNNGILV